MKTVIITLDIINEICNEKGLWARYVDRIIESNIIGKINQITQWARNQTHLVCHVRIGFSPHYLDGSSRSSVFSAAQSANALNLSEWGGAFCDDLNREANDTLVIKHRVSAFYGTDLDFILRANQVEHLILCGVATNNAIELTAREAHDRDYRVTVVSDAVQTLNDKEQQASLAFMEKIATLVNTGSLIL